MKMHHKTSPRNSPSKPNSPSHLKSLNTTTTARSPPLSPRQYIPTDNIKDVIEGVKGFHKEIINQMELDRGNQYEHENVRISRLVLETLWIHFLEKSFRLEDAAGDVQTILEGVKELKNDWSMMVRHYQGFQKKVVRRIRRSQQDGEEEIDEDKVIKEIDRLIKEKDEYQRKIGQLKKEIQQLKITQPSRPQHKNLVSKYKIQQRSEKHQFNYEINKKELIERIKGLNEQNMELSESFSSQEQLQQEKQQQTVKKQIMKQLPFPILLKKQSSSKFNASDMFYQSDIIELPKRNQLANIKQLININQQLGQQHTLLKQKELLVESLSLLGKAKSVLIEYGLGRRNSSQNSEEKNKHAQFVRNKILNKQINSILQEIQKVEDAAMEMKQINTAIHNKLNSNKEVNCEEESNINESQQQCQYSQQISSSNSNQNGQYHNHLQSLKQIQYESLQNINPKQLITTKRISKQTQFILLQQQLCKTLQQLSKQKIQNKLISKQLILKQNQLTQLQEYYKQVIEELQDKQSGRKVKTPRGSYKPSQNLLAISELYEEPTSQEHQSSKQHEIIHQTQELANRRTSKLQSLFSCLFPDQQNQKPTIKQIKKLKKQVESYNINQNLSSTLVEGEITPLQMVILSLQNFLQHLSTLSHSNRNNVLISLKNQVVSITNNVQEEQEQGSEQGQGYKQEKVEEQESDSSMSTRVFEDEVRQIIEKVYEDNESPIRREIEEFAYYLQGKSSGELLYLIEQFVRRIGKIEFGRDSRGSYDNNQTIDRGMTQRLTVNTSD